MAPGGSAAVECSGEQRDKVRRVLHVRNACVAAETQLAPDRWEMLAAILPER